MEVLMRLRSALLLLIFTLFTTIQSFGITADEAKLSIQEYFQTGEPEKALNLANQFRDKNPEFRRLSPALLSGNTPE